MMDYTTIVSELDDLLERMDNTFGQVEGDDWWIIESERNALVHAIAIINDLIEERS